MQVRASALLPANKMQEKDFSIRFAAINYELKFYVPGV